MLHYLVQQLPVFCVIAHLTLSTKSMCAGIHHAAAVGIARIALSFWLERYRDMRQLSVRNGHDLVRTAGEKQGE